MSLTTIITDILEEDFEVPATIGELGDLIENSCDVYHHATFASAERKAWKNKVNDLIEIYNERRNLHIYNSLK